MSKEDKFFEALREFAGYAEKAGRLMLEAVEGKKDTEAAYHDVSSLKRDCCVSYGKLTEKMYKAYKDPSDLDVVRGITGRIYKTVGILKDLLSHMELGEVGNPPEEYRLMARLSAEALDEMKKTLDYTVDVGSNYMKMEARCQRIYTFEERGDECCRSAMRKLYNDEAHAVRLIYWKEIFDNLEEVLDASAGMVPLLQKLITHY